MTKEQAALYDHILRENPVWKYVSEEAITKIEIARKARLLWYDRPIFRDLFWFKYLPRKLSEFLRGGRP